MIAAAMPRSLPVSPVTLPMLVAVVVFVTWAATEAGLPLSHWYPGTLFLLGLLAATAFVLSARGRDLPRATKVAGIFLLGFTAWSYASILWAEAQSDAWDGANRTLLYLVVFALFALWHQDEAGATVVLGTWVLGIAGMGLVNLLVVTAADDPGTAFIGDRLAEPAGYTNAAAATLMMAFFPALVLAGRRELLWWSRGIFAAAALLLADVALLSQSRGSIYAFPILVVLFFMFVPGRVRSFAVLLVVGGAVAATAPGVLDVGRRLRDGETAVVAMSGAARPIVLAALVVAALVTALARFDRIRRLPVPTERRLARAVGAVGVAGAALGVIVALAIAGNPVDLVRDGWRSFKQEDQPVMAANTSSRLGSGLGSNRYDFYRVALDNFADRPLVGKGGDNFERDYLVRGRSLETPRYPHSLELRTLSELGIVGALLLLGVVAGVFAGAVAAMRRGPPLGRAVAGGAAMVFAYWLVHGSFEWFFEFAGLGAPAFAMAGLACALIPRPGAAEAEAAAAHPLALVHGWAVPAGVAAVLVAGVSLVLPYLAERNVLVAARTWPDDPQRAYERLDRAADLNPVSVRPALIAGSIALRLNDLPRARAAFTEAIRREPRTQYAALELGAIASQLGQRRLAERELARAVALAPRDRIARAALARVRAGKRIDVDTLNRLIFTKARKLVQ